MVVWRNYYTHDDGLPVWGGYAFDHEPRARVNAEIVGRGACRCAYRIRVTFRSRRVGRKVMGGLLVEGPSPHTA